MMKIDVMNDLSEIVRYDHTGVPLYIRTGVLSLFDDMNISCHWHDAVEWVYILSGTMCFFVNDTRFLLGEGDVLMVNSRQLHYVQSHQKRDCHFSCLLFHPSLFCHNQHLFRKYVGPVLENDHFPCLYFGSSHPSRQEISGYLTRIAGLKEGGAEAYEMEVVAAMHAMWGRLWRQQELKPARNGRQMQDDLNIQKNMVSFIYQHYGEKISLDEIAAAGNVSRSKCCRVFKRYLQQSPVDFLNAYRLKVSRYLLENSDRNITEIALSCGFNHLSYYSRYFYENYGTTPRDYRKCHKARA